MGWYSEKFILYACSISKFKFDEVMVWDSSWSDSVRELSSI